jgi:carbon-monoxide dehydrogenase medium subunit
VTVRGVQGERTVRAEDFLLSPFEVDVRPGELLTHLDLPATELDWTFLELSRRHGDFAIVMAAVGVRLAGGRCAAARIVVGGASATPVRMRAAEQALVEADAADDGLADEVARQAASELDPTSDVHGSADYRRQVAEVLLRRALRQAFGGAR